MIGLKVHQVHQIETQTLHKSFTQLTDVEKQTKAFSLYKKTYKDEILEKEFYSQITQLTLDEGQKSKVCDLICRCCFFRYERRFANRKNELNALLNEILNSLFEVNKALQTSNLKEIPSAAIFSLIKNKDNTSRFFPGYKTLPSYLKRLTTHFLFSNDKKDLNLEYSVYFKVRAVHQCVVQYCLDLFTKKSTASQFKFISTANADTIVEDNFTEQEKIQIEIMRTEENGLLEPHSFVKIRYKNQTYIVDPCAANVKSSSRYPDQRDRKFIFLNWQGFLDTKRCGWYMAYFAIQLEEKLEKNIVNSTQDLEDKIKEIKNKLLYEKQPPEKVVSRFFLEKFYKKTIVLEENSSIQETTNAKKGKSKDYKKPDNYEEVDIEIFFQ